MKKSAKLILKNKFEISYTFVWTQEQLDCIVIYCHKENSLVYIQKWIYFALLLIYKCVEVVAFICN